MFTDELLTFVGFSVFAVGILCSRKLRNKIIFGLIGLVIMIIGMIVNSNNHWS